MSVSPRDSDDLQLSAYCDGELDLPSAIAFEQRLKIDASFGVRYEQLLSLRAKLRALPQDGIPHGLEARLASALDTEAPAAAKRLHHQRWSSRALAAAAVVGAVLSASVMMTLQSLGSHQDLARDVVGSHIRGLLAAQPFEIASSDRHTVKPWFTKRLPEPPQVIDLAPQGFALIGGRVDVVGQVPVATMVYRHAAHLVSLTALRSGQSVADDSISGYNVLSWSNSGTTYVAVSDLSPEDLAAFERAFCGDP
jgi:anti-sigma factor RsiW